MPIFLVTAVTVTAEIIAKVYSCIIYNTEAKLLNQSGSEHKMIIKM
jgi:hypothetical protein